MSDAERWKSVNRTGAFVVDFGFRARSAARCGGPKTFVRHDKGKSVLPGR
jgi:hypothetical protein